jgi:uncharacterized membrane protein
LKFLKAFKMKLTNIKPQTFFLVAAILWGLVNIMLTPPFQVPDEPAHFFKALQVANGHFFPEVNNNHIGGYFPKGAETILLPYDSLFHEMGKRISFHDIIEASKIRFDANTETFIQFPTSARLFPMPYFPQVLGISLGKLIFHSPLIWLYLGRLFNLLTWIILIVFSIKLTPIHKWTMVILALLPMHINLAASLSADTFTNAISFLGIAIFLQIGLSGHFIEKKPVFWMLAVLLLIALSKNVYVLIGLLFFIVPLSKFPNRRFYLISIALTALVGLSGFLIGSYYTNWIYNLTDPGVPFFFHLSETLHQVDHHKQLGFILENPVDYLSVLAGSLRNQWQALVYSGIGVLGWLNVILPFWYYVMIFMLLPAIAISENIEKLFLNRRQKLLILVVITLAVVLIFTVSYLTWTPVGKTTIDGLQGRYFIPLLPLIFLLFYNGKIALPHQIVKLISFSIVIISFFVSTFAIHHRYWDFFE